MIPDPETLVALVFLTSPVVVTATTMLLANRSGARSSWSAVLLTSLVALGLAFPVGFTVVGSFISSPVVIFVALIVFGIFVGMLGHKVTRRAAHG